MLIGLLILFSKITCQLYSLYEISSDITLNYSYALSTIRYRLLSHLSNSIINSTSDLIQVDKDVESSFTFYQSNIDFAYGYPSLSYIILNYDILGESYINYRNYHKDTVFFPLKVTNKK